MNDFNEQNNSFNANGWEGYIPDSYKPTPKQQNKKPVWAAVTSFVLSLVSFCIGCCCNCSIVMVILSIIFGIISLANGWRGKGLAISGIIISAVTLVFSIASIVLMNTTFKDAQEYYTELLTNPQKYIDEYEETGRPPEILEKYGSEEYDDFWKAMGFEDFEEFYSVFMDSFIEGYNGASGGNYDRSSSYDYSDDDGHDYGYDDEFSRDPVEI